MDASAVRDEKMSNVTESPPKTTMTTTPATTLTTIKAAEGNVEVDVLKRTLEVAALAHTAQQQAKAAEMRLRTLEKIYMRVEQEVSGFHEVANSLSHSACSVANLALQITNYLNFDEVYRAHPEFDALLDVKKVKNILGGGAVGHTAIHPIARKSAGNTKHKTFASACGGGPCFMNVCPNNRSPRNNDDSSSSSSFYHKRPNNKRCKAKASVKATTTFDDSSFRKCVLNPTPPVRDENIDKFMLQNLPFFPTASSTSPVSDSSSQEQKCSDVVTVAGASSKTISSPENNDMIEQKVDTSPICKNMASTLISALLSQMPPRRMPPRKDIMASCDKSLQKIPETEKERPHSATIRTNFTNNRNAALFIPSSSSSSPSVSLPSSEWRKSDPARDFKVNVDTYLTKVDEYEKMVAGYLRMFSARIAQKGLKSNGSNQISTTVDNNLDRPIHKPTNTTCVPGSELDMEDNEVAAIMSSRPVVKSTALLDDRATTEGALPGTPLNDFPSRRQPIISPLLTDTEKATASYSENLQTRETKFYYQPRSGNNSDPGRF